MSEKRIDPDDGVAYTKAELTAFYKGKFKRFEIDAYWESCKPAKRAKGGKAEPATKAKAKAKTKVKAKAKASSKKEYKPKGPKLDLYTNPICPFAHRAVFAAALCNLEPNIIIAPLSGQVKAAELLGMAAAHQSVGWLETPEKVAAYKEEYKKTVNASGEVPTLKTPKGDLIFESEIVSEYIDQATRGHKKLVPQNPVLAAKVRLAMKKFNDVVGTLYGLLTNQDASADAEKAKNITDKLAAFAAVIDKDAKYCFGDNVTLVDVHCAPFLYRFNILLPHYRGFKLFTDQPSGDRLPKLLDTLQSMPEFQKLTPITEADLLEAYALYANGFKWADKPTMEKKYNGRGKSDFGK